MRIATYKTETSNNFVFNDKYYIGYEGHNHRFIFIDFINKKHFFKKSDIPCCEYDDDVYVYNFSDLIYMFITSWDNLRYYVFNFNFENKVFEDIKTCEIHFQERIKHLEFTENMNLLIFTPDSYIKYIFKDNQDFILKKKKSIPNVSTIYRLSENNYAISTKEGIILNLKITSD